VSRLAGPDAALANAAIGGDAVRARAGSVIRVRVPVAVSAHAPP
jgi:hypothetical protein